MKRFAIGLVVLGVIGLLAGGEAMAGKKNKKNGVTSVNSFAALDKNGDGKLSLDEFQAGKTDAAEAEKSFKAFDKDGDGSLTKDEFAAAAPTVEKIKKNKEKKNKNK